MLYIILYYTYSTIFTKIYNNSYLHARLIHIRQALEIEIENKICMLQNNMTKITNKYLGLKICKYTCW